MTRFRTSLLTLITVLSVAVGGCSSAPDRPERTFGLSSDGENAGVSSAFATGAELGREPEVVNFFEAWAWQRRLPVDTLYEIHNRGAIPAVTWEPWDPNAGEYQDGYSPSRIAAGEFDAYITQWADAAAQFDQPMQIRFAHEMNGSWYPWSVDGSRSTADDYLDAYRRVHDIFMRTGANKVQWVWSFDASSGRAEGLPIAEASYPGDMYVDLIGIDGYNGGGEATSWQTPDEVFGGALQTANTVAPGKPVWIYETGTGDQLGDKPAWITDLFEYLDTTSVSGLLWFDFDKEGEANWRLDSSPAALDAASGALSAW
ncbi:MAG: glycosyl hydrolase [Rhodococcus sp. (in: high G+C Gram-positive bacteria)]